MNVAGDDKILLYMDTDNTELLVSDDIQCILKLLGRTVPVHMEDLRCCRLAGWISVASDENNSGDDQDTDGTKN